MATSKDDMSYKLTFRKYDDGDHQWGNFGDQIFEGDASHKCPTYVHRTPPRVAAHRVKIFVAG